MKFLLPRFFNNVIFKESIRLYPSLKQKKKKKTCPFFLCVFRIYIYIYNIFLYMLAFNVNIVHLPPTVISQLM